MQAIAISAAYLNDWPMLVVCPSSVRAMWAQEVGPFLRTTLRDVVLSQFVV